MTLLLRVPGISFTDTTIPILRNDRIANNGTLDIFDALDADVSWPAQADPIEGTDTWKSLIGSNSAEFAGTVGWSNGFTLDATADTITLPATFKRGAAENGVVSFWIKFGTQAFTSGSNNYIARVGNIGTGNQWVCYMQYGTTDANTFVAVYSGNNAGTALPLTQISTLGASKIAHIAVSMELIGGVYVYKGFWNGSKIDTFTSALTSLPQPAAAPYFGGSANPVNMTVLRAAVDNLSVVTPEEFVALEYATYSSRFT